MLLGDLSPRKSLSALLQPFPVKRYSLSLEVLLQLQYSQEAS
jgi:hypothetical protein